MKRIVTVNVNPDFCTGCHICVVFCPRHVLELSSEVGAKGVHLARAVRPEDCTACRLCELYCPDFAIAVQEGAGPREG